MIQANESKSKILLITGTPGVGKTTAVRKLADLLAGRTIAGFYTAEIRANNVRQGFELVPFDGPKMVIAHVDFPKIHRVGKYGVDVAAIDAASEQLLSHKKDVEVYIVDEIGKMECLSTVFTTAMRFLLDSGKQVVATVSMKGRGFMEEVKRRNDIEIWQINQTNREQMPSEMRDWLTQ